MTAQEQNIDLARRIRQRCHVDITAEDAGALRRAELALHRWAERECGDGSGYHIERDEKTDKPRNVNDMTGKGYAISDMERGALRRISEVCNRLGLSYIHQGDPRGCALYVHSEPIDQTNYTNGAACCA